MRTLYEILILKLQIWRITVECWGYKAIKLYHSLRARYAARELNRITVQILNTGTVRQIQDHGADLAYMGAKARIPAYIRFGEQLINDADHFVTLRIKGSRFSVKVKFDQ